MVIDQRRAHQRILYEQFMFTLTNQESVSQQLLFPQTMETNASDAALLISMLWMFRVIIAYVVIAIVISFICEPVAEGLTRIRIRKWRLPDWARAMVALTSFLLLIILWVLWVEQHLSKTLNLGQ